MLPSRPTSACGNPPRWVGGADPLMLPRRFGDATGVFGALIAGAIAGGGMFTLARVFQSLTRRKPDLDAGTGSLRAGLRSKPYHPGSSQGPPP